MIVSEAIEYHTKMIAYYERLKECFELRLHHLRTEHSKKNAYEKNESDIIEIQTHQKINNLKEIIQDKKVQLELVFADYITQLENAYNENNSNMCNC